MKKSIVEEVDELTLDQKINIWLDYMVTQKSVKHFYGLMGEIFGDVDLFKKNNPDATVYPLFKMYNFSVPNECYPILTLNEFTDKQRNIQKVDYESGVQINYSGIYEWYRKFKNRILL